MKKILLGILVIGSLSFSAKAQDSTKMDHQQKHWNKHRDGMGWKSLNLTPDQRNQLKASNEDYRKQLQELNKNENITVKEFRDKQYSLRKEHKAKMLALLTPDQKAKLEQMKQERQQQREAMAEKKLEKMKIKLGLSDDQVAQIKAKGEEIHNKIQSIKENDNLSRTEKKEQLEALKSERKDSFKKILTPDQLNKLEEMKKARMDKTPT